MCDLELWLLELAAGECANFSAVAEVNCKLLSCACHKVYDSSSVSTCRACHIHGIRRDEGLYQPSLSILVLLYLQVQRYIYVDGPPNTIEAIAIGPTIGLSNGDELWQELVQTPAMDIGGWHIAGSIFRVLLS